MSAQTIVFSTDPDYFAAAQRELGMAFPDATVERLGSDLGRLTGGPDELPALLDRIRDVPVVFVRHLMREVAMLPVNSVRRDKQSVSKAVIDLVSAGTPLALQIWSSGESKLTYGAEELWHHLSDEFGRRGSTVTRSGADITLGLCIIGTGIVVGVTPRLDGYADWPGGRIRLRKDEGQISRAEFKLEELLTLGAVTLPDHGLAVDLGAAPGGWTRILRRAGLRVVAVDPGDLDERLGSDEGITHVPQTAGPFLARMTEPIDVVVNDMRMIPAMSVDLMLTASGHLASGSLGIMTLKLTPHFAVETVDRAITALSQAYHIVFARQLYHNRNEATVVVRKR